MKDRKCEIKTESSAPKYRLEARHSPAGGKALEQMDVPHALVCNPSFFIFYVVLFSCFRALKNALLTTSSASQRILFNRIPNPIFIPSGFQDISCGTGKLAVRSFVRL